MQPTYPSPGVPCVAVANPNGKLSERLNADAATTPGVLELAAGVDLATGRWPHGGPTLRDPAPRPGLRADQQNRSKCVGRIRHSDS